MLDSNERTIKPHILSGPPGTGKTREKVNELKKTKGRKIILGPSHDYLSEQEAWILNSKHWWGLASKFGCPCLQESEDSRIPEKEAKRKLIQRLVSLKFTYDYVCSTCEDINAYPQKKCPYQKQFHKIRSFPFVLAPIAYAFTKRISEYDPQEIVVDDCILNLKEHPTKNELEFRLQGLVDDTETMFKLDSKLTLEELNNRHDYNIFINKLRGPYRKKINKLVAEAKEKDWEKNSSSYLEHYLVSPDDIDTYCKLARIYGYQEQFATPAVFYLFDYIIKMKEEGKDIKLTIIDAKPNTSFLKSLSDRYYKENHVIVEFVYDKFEPKIVDHGSVVHQMTSRGSLYFKESLKNLSTKMSVKEITEWILNRRHNNNLNLKIGTIINKPKDSMWLSKEEYNRRLNNKMRLFIPERFKNVTIRTRYNIRGMNSFENCDVLLIYGTPIISKYQIEKQFVFWNGYKPKTLETVEKEPHGGYYHYVDKELETFRQLREEDEGYHEIHRIRLFLVKKDVYVFGKVPKSIEEEGISVEKINKNYITNFERNKWIEEFVQQRSPVPAFVVEEAMVKQFDEIKSQRWAYQIVLKIVKENKHLTMRNRGIFYEDKK